ncbi:ABC transporter ATP-binding protein [Hahella sp. SMD15-11]|uniref:ABC transporter ATP-binding protein n=1 Tax=Thermohahella caldifontis TaxID=3142973 RepID=A0AB39UZQ9_9GAMM
MTTERPELEVTGLACRYDETPVLQDVTFHLNRGGLASLLGPSGCGKTTLLKALAGFQPVDAGQIVLAGQVLSRPGMTVPPENRRIGMVFQDYALFPHLTVADNIGFGLHRLDKASRKRVVADMLDLVGLHSVAEQYPHELSGGQQQRVALARALAPEPELLLMDEPFSNLDAELRLRLSLDVRDILRQRKTSAILVTHDQNEAFALADHVGVLHQGRLQQWDTPYNLYHNPENRFVAGFVGRGSFVPGRLETPDSVATELGVIRGDRAYIWPPGTAVDVLLRPDDIVLDEQSGLRALIRDKIFSGSSTLYRLTLPSGLALDVLAPSHQDYPTGTEIGLRLVADHLIAFPVSP